jgi:hypothetical protein
MHWSIPALNQPLRRRLAEISGRQGTGGPCYFQSLRRPGWLPRFLAAGGLLTLGGAVPLGLAWQDVPKTPLVWALIATGAWLLLATWTVVIVAEMVRTSRSDIQPFLLVTPKVLLRSDYAHGSLEARRLRDATDFTSTDTYTGDKQTYAGRVYTFLFPGASVRFAVATAEGRAVLEEVLAAARAGQGDDADLELLPPAGGRPTPPGLRAFTRPTGEFWITLLACSFLFALVGMVAKIVVSAIIGR